MNKEILSEINRVREIMGVKLITEATGGPKWVATGSDELFSAISDVNPTFKSTLDDFGNTMYKNIDEIDDPLVRKFRESIEEVMDLQSGGWYLRTSDEIFADPALRKTVEDLFIGKFKKSTELVEEFINNFYAKNPSITQFTDKKFITDFINKAAAKGINDLEKVEQSIKDVLANFTVKAADGTNVKLPQVIQDDIMNVVSQAVGKNVTKKVTKTAIENTIDGVITSVNGLNPKIAKKLKGDTDWRNKVADLLKKYDNDLAKVNREFDNTVNTWVRKNSQNGVSEETLFGQVKKYASEFFDMELIKQLKWDKRQTFLQNLGRILTTLGLGGFGIASFFWWDKFVNSQSDTPRIIEIRSMFSYLPTTLRADYFNLIIQSLGGEAKAMEILKNPNISYTWAVYDPGFSDYVSETEYLTTISLDGKELKIESDNEGEDPVIISNTFGGAGGGGTTSTTMTKAQAIEAIKGKNYVDPITLTPNEENQTTYTYVDGEGLEGTVTLVDGNIKVQ